MVIDKCYWFLFVKLRLMMVSDDNTKVSYDLNDFTNELLLFNNDVQTELDNNWIKRNSNINSYIENLTLL